MTLPGFVDATPPDTLYHGADRDAATVILKEGLLPAPGQHVHLRADRVSARKAGTQVVFTVYAGVAHAEGQTFWRSDDGAWLTGAVDPEFLYLSPIRGAE
ncbi:hypothetical protein HA397_30865 [Escherichia coli]|nr:hypothetical protein [Escherichia coli]